MRATVCSVIWVALSTLTTLCLGRALIAADPPPQYHDLLPRATGAAAATTSNAAAAATSGAAVCKRDLMIRDEFIVVREPKPYQLVKRVEKNIPGK